MTNLEQCDLALKNIEDEYIAGVIDYRQLMKERVYLWEARCQIMKQDESNETQRNSTV